MSKAAELANLIGNINMGGGGVNRNLVINGDMSVSQRSTSVSSITGAGYKVLDRHRLGGAVPGTWTWSQSTTVPSGQGFGNSLKLDCTATGSAGTMYIQHKMEGQNLQGFAKGTSDAKPFALSFWVRSNKTGTYIAMLLDNDNTRHVSKSYTISSANTWEHKKITFPADTTGAFDNDNGASLEIYLWLSADSSNSSGTLATTWASSTTANNAVGQVNLADSTDNEWYLTGLQFEIGQNPTEFEHEPIERTLSKCQRYFEIYNGTVYFFDINDPAVAQSMHMGFNVKKVKNPSVTLGTGSGFDSLYARTDHDQTQGVCITGSHSSNAQATIASPAWQADAEL